MAGTRTGKLISQVYTGIRQVVCTIMVDAPFDEKLAEKELSITMEVKRNKRGLSANAYFHKLLTLMAEHIGISLTEVKNHILSEYGQFEMIQGAMVTVVLRDDIDWMKIDALHLKPTTEIFTAEDGALMRKYHVIRGSHTYDTKEFSRLLDGCISEAKSIGIETLPPDEIERMKEAYEINYNRKHG